jgi:HEAT repeat protein
VDKSEAVVLAAVRGLAGQDSLPALEALSRLLYDPTRLLSVRCEAASALARMRQPGAMEALGHAAAQIDDEAILSHLLDSAGDRPLSESSAFLRNYLQAPAVSTDLKVTAWEALGQAPGEVGTFLSEYLGNSDPEIRAAAAWALSTADEPGAVTSQLMPLLQSEPDAEVRERLYQALANQENVDWQSVLPALQKESDPNSRLAGWDLLAGLLRDNQLEDSPSPQQLAYFDQTGVPEFKNTALTGTPGTRERAIIALKRAGTPAALEAVQYVNDHAAEPAEEQSPPQNP